MCRNIKMLFNFAPPVTEEEIRAASLQFVRKVSGFNKPSKANEPAFLAAVDGIAAVSRDLLSDEGVLYSSWPECCISCSGMPCEDKASANYAWDLL